MLEYLVRDRRRLRRGTRAFVREVDLGDVRVFVDHGFQWDGAANVWLTRARASFAVQGGPVFAVRPRSTFARLLGYQGGVACGDPCFDYFFAVRTAEPSETWRALTTRVRSLLAGEFEDAHLESDGRMITLWREADFGREVDAAAAIEIVHEVAQHRGAVLETLRRLPGAVPCAARGPWDARIPAAVELGAPTAVRLGPALHHGRAVMAASTACGRAAPWFDVGFDDEPVLARRGLPARVLDAAFDLGAAGLGCDGNRIALRWPDLGPTREVMLEGAALVGRIAAALVGGVYR